MLSVVVPYSVAFAAMTLIVMAQTIFDPGLSTFWDRTIGNQVGRESPFSIWGQTDRSSWLHTALKIAVAALAVRSPSARAGATSSRSPPWARRC